MKIQNVFNIGRDVYLFCRDEKGKLQITTDKKFYPYYYTLDMRGEFNTHDGNKASKVIVSNPYDIKKQKDANSYEADVLYNKRYIIDKIDKFDKTPIKYFFIDIEILASDMPDIKRAKEPISCISIYNSISKEIKTWFLLDYQTEKLMLADFIAYIKKEAPDLILAWNVSFDYTYLFNRIPYFDKSISPLGGSRFGDFGVPRQKDEITPSFPIGISILDYMLLFKRMYMREQSYALDKVCQKYLGEEAWKKTKFGTLDSSVKEKNINDIKRMIKLEEKFKIIEYYDEVRRYSTCLWEDVVYNSKVLDMLVLREAKKRKLVLASKNMEDREEEKLEGAYRRSEVGVFYNIYKADVGGMYPNQLINFCLDTSNITNDKSEDTIEVNGINFKQDQTALLPFVAKNLVEQKDILKTTLKKLDKNSETYEQEKKRYDAIKALVNSLYGVLSLQGFRLYDMDIASSITFLARDLLHYVEDNMKALGHQVIYLDTDSIFYTAEKDETDLLNQLIQNWSIEKYNKANINISFEGEGKFTRLLLLGKCHYLGYIESKKGEIKEIKGMEIKRSSSSKFEAKFQEVLIDKILNKETQDNIVDWIENELERIKKVEIRDIAFPCKIGTTLYKGEPIFIRAYNNTRKFHKEFNINRGEIYYYVYVKSLGTDDKGKDINVLAISDDFIPKDLNIDWDEMTRRSIYTKTNNILEALNWGSLELLLSKQSLFN